MIALMRLGLLLVMVSAASVNTSEIKVLSITATGLMAMMEQIAPEFERATGHKITVTYGLGLDLRKRIGDGEAFDVIILTRLSAVQRPAISPTQRQSEPAAQAVAAMSKLRRRSDPECSLHRRRKLRQRQTKDDRCQCP